MVFLTLYYYTFLKLYHTFDQNIKAMYHSIIVALFALFSPTLQAQEASLKQDLKRFTSLEISSGLQVVLQKHETPHIEIYGDFSNVEITQEHDILKLSKESKIFSNSTPNKIVVYYTSLERLTISSGCAVSSRDIIDTEDLDIRLSSGSSANLEIKTKHTKTAISSGSALKLKGTTKSLDIDVNSGSSYSSFDLLADEVRADASTGSSVEVLATKIITAKASLGGSIIYRGNPVTRLKQSMGGQIEHSAK